MQVWHELEEGSNLQDQFLVAASYGFYKNRIEVRQKSRSKLDKPARFLRLHKFPRDFFFCYFY